MNEAVGWFIILLITAPFWGPVLGIISGFIMLIVMTFIGLCAKFVK